MMKEDSSILVSVVTPSYNQGQYLEQTIQSVLNQTYPNVEYLVIDGGSTDNSIEIIKKYKEKIAFWISEPDSGQADAINKGFKRAKGDLLCWVNSDDIVYPHYIADRVNQFREHPDVGMIYGDIEQGPDFSNKRIRKGRQTSIEDMLKSFECPIPQQSAVWRRSVIEKIGYLVPKWHAMLDREYFIRVAANFPIKYVPGAVAFFRNHEQSKSINQKVTWADEMPACYENIFKDDIYRLSPVLLSYQNQCLARVYLKCAKIYGNAGKTQEAEELFRKSKKASLYQYLLRRHLKRLF